MMVRRTLALLALTAFVSFSAWAQQSKTPPPFRIRGEVEKFESGRITVRTRSGDTVVAKVGEKVIYNGITKIDFSEVTEGKYIGIASQPQKDGSLKALDVFVFPEAARGQAEGHFPWDLTPDSMMTNANVSASVSSKDGRVLTLSPKDKSGKETHVKIEVPATVPVVTLAPADEKMVVKGAKVVLFAIRQADGSILTNRVAIGIGITPPM